MVVSSNSIGERSPVQIRSVPPLRRWMGAGLSAPARGLPPFFRRPCALWGARQEPAFPPLLASMLDRSRHALARSPSWLRWILCILLSCLMAAPMARVTLPIPRHTRSGGRSDRPEDPMAMLSCPYIHVQLLSRASRAAGGASPVPSISLVPAGNPINYLHLSSTGDAPILCSQPGLSSPSDAATDW